MSITTTGIFLQSGIYSLLNQWESFGVFDLILPFLLIFCIVFGVLNSTNILGGNKGISVIIAIAIAMMSLRLDFVSIFFTELFPRFAMGLAVLVVVVIMAGLFIPNDWKVKGWFIFFGILGTIIALISSLSTFAELNYFNSPFWQEWTTTIVSVIVVIAIIIGIILGTDKTTDPDHPKGEIKFKAFRE